MRVYFRIFVLAAVVMGLSHTLAKERLFAPIRERLGGRETYFGYLLSCPYCNSHFLAFALVPLTGTYVVEIAPQWGVLSAIAGWFLSSIFITVMAAFLRIAFYLVDESQGLLRREIVKTEAEARLAQENAAEVIGARRESLASSEEARASSH
jgi:hypothetical protein